MIDSIVHGEETNKFIYNHKDKISLNVCDAGLV
jgi:hypothetical protein